MYRKSNHEKDRGITLLEVLISLVITGVIVSVVLTFYISQYRLNGEVMVGAEWNYSLVRSGQVLASAIRSGEVVEWTDKGLQITYHSEGRVIKDIYYLADKDFDGTVDLYREHLAVPNPIASGLKAFSVTEIKKGLWLINLEATDGKNKASWVRKVRQMVCRN